MLLILVLFDLFFFLVGHPQRGFTKISSGEYTDSDRGSRLQGAQHELCDREGPICLGTRLRDPSRREHLPGPGEIRSGTIQRGERGGPAPVHLSAVR